MATTPITSISDKEIHDKIQDVLFQLREEAVVRDGETISNLSPEQYQHFIVKLVRENIVLSRRVRSHEKCMEHRRGQLDYIKTAVKLIQKTISNEYESE